MSERSQALPGLLAMPDVQAVFGRSPRTIRRWIRRGHLVPVRIGGAVFFRESDIRKLIAGDLRAACGLPDTAQPDNG